MQQLVSELSRPMVLSDRALRQLECVKRAQRSYVQAHGGEPSVRQLAAEAEMTTDQVERLMAADRSARPLDGPADRDGSPEFTLGDILSDPRSEDAFDQIPLHTAVDKLPSMLVMLGSRERRVVGARYGLEGGESTLREIATMLGVSAERVRQIEEGSLRKMREASMRPGYA
jgi:RNA polymerase primary sigma factor